MVGFQIASQVGQVIFSTPMGAFHDMTAQILPDDDMGSRVTFFTISGIVLCRADLRLLRHQAAMTRKSAAIRSTPTSSCARWKRPKPERTTMTDFTPETPVLTPIRDHAAELAKAEAGVAEMAAKRNNRWYPKYPHRIQRRLDQRSERPVLLQGPLARVLPAAPVRHPVGSDALGPRLLHRHAQLEARAHHVRTVSRAGEGRRVLRFRRHRRQRRPSSFYYTGHRWANGHDNTGGDWQVQMTRRSRTTTS